MARCGMPASPLHKRITYLSTKAVATKEPEELEKVIPDLRVALHEQANRLRYMVDDAKENISHLASQSRLERRKVERRKTERRQKKRENEPSSMADLS